MHGAANTLCQRLSECSIAATQLGDVAGIRAKAKAVEDKLHLKK